MLDGRSALAADATKLAAVTVLPPAGDRLVRR